MPASHIPRRIVFSVAAVLGISLSNAEWEQRFGRVAGVNQYVYTIYPTASNVLVGGQFTAAGATSADQSATWDGADWRSFAPLPESRFSGHVSNLLVDSDGAPVVIFQRNTSADYPTFRVWRWNGSSWSSLGAIARGATRDALFFNNKLALFGSFSDTAFSTEGQTQLDGTNWIRGGLTNFGVNSVCEFNGEVYVAGRSVRSAAALQRFGKWTGQKWQELGPILDVNLGPIKLVATTNALYSLGYFHQPSRYEVARWNGSAWDVVFPRDTNAPAPLPFNVPSPIAATDSAVYYAYAVNSADLAMVLSSAGTSGTPAMCGLIMSRAGMVPRGTT
jgi:hypothetical protein